MEPKKKINPRRKQSTPTKPVRPQTGLKIRVTEEKKPRKVDKCREHNEDMKFDAEAGLWKCPIPWCGEGGPPKADATSDAIILGKGEVEAFMVRKKSDGSIRPTRNQSNVGFYIRTPENNVLIDVTPYVTSWVIENDGGPSSIEVTLRLRRLTQASE